MSDEATELRAFLHKDFAFFCACMWLKFLDQQHNGAARAVIDAWRQRMLRQLVADAPRLSRTQAGITQDVLNDVTAELLRLTDLKVDSMP